MRRSRPSSSRASWAWTARASRSAGFLRNPADGGGPFEGHEIGTEWHLTPEQADRIRRHFRKAPKGE